MNRGGAAGDQVGMHRHRANPAFFPSQAHVKVSVFPGERAGLSLHASVDKTTWLGSRLQALSFAVRATALRGIRAGRNLAWPAARCARLTGEPAAWREIVGASSTSLWTSAGGAEWRLTAGKIENLRVGARHLDRLVIPAGRVFSFWRQVPRPIRVNGFVAGRELREGCMVSSIGGGLCQLSNALYAAALEAGCEIVERHAHSKVVPGSLAERGLDATVFWNYLDLRFRPLRDMVLEVELTAHSLEVRLRAVDAKAGAAIGAKGTPRTGDLPHDCVACRHRSCVHAIKESGETGRTAWLLDACWPEFDAWMLRHRRAGDSFHLPLLGRRGYAWGVTPGAARQHPFLALWRSAISRRLAAQGARRQQVLLDFYRRFAKAYATELPVEADRVVVAIDLLAYLREYGALGGRRVTVLMTRPPLSLLQAQLDLAARLHPQSSTLKDFRADSHLIALEEAALRQAEVLVTPHRALAAALAERYPAGIEIVDWQMPRSAAAPRGKVVLFPASALARKGAFEMRAAAKALSLDLRVLGETQETGSFWNGVRLISGGDTWDGIGCVALPAHVEHQPRLLLQAMARGIPVVCTASCGLAPSPGVHIVKEGDAAALIEALAGVLGEDRALAAE